MVDNTAELDAQKDCIRDRLDHLDAIVVRAEATGRLPPIGPLGHPPFSPWRNAVWEGMTAGQTAAHLPHDKLLAYSSLATQSDYLANLSDTELDQWNTLSTMTGPGRRFSDVEAETLRVTLAKARFSADKMISTSRLAVDRIRATGMIDAAAFAAAATHAAAKKQTVEICRPLQAGA